MQPAHSAVPHRHGILAADAFPATLSRTSPRADKGFSRGKRVGNGWQLPWTAGPLCLLRRRRLRIIVLLLCTLLLSAAVLLAPLLPTLWSPWQKIENELHGRLPSSSNRLPFLEDEMAENDVFSSLLFAGNDNGSSEDDGLCVVCAAGHVLFRAHRQATISAVDSVGPTSQEVMVCQESVEASESRTPPLSTLRDCVARLRRLGLLQPPRATVLEHHNDACVQLRVLVHYVGSSAANDTMPARQCGAVVAQLRSRRKCRHTVELTTRRLTVWPTHTPTLPPETRGAQVANPAYVGTALVHDTDVDSDIPPPDSITVGDSLREFVVRFGPSATADTAVVDLRCPLRFLTARLGRFGRHHSQLQEVLHGVALAARLNRTFLLPPFVAANYTESVRLDSEVLYGWQTLRQVGRHCLLTYGEGRPLLRRLSVERGGSLAMARVHVTAEAIVEEERVWGTLPRVPFASAAPLYDADAWFACGVPKTQQQHDAAGGGAGNDSMPLFLMEAYPPSVYIALQSPTQTRFEAHQAAARAMVKEYGGAAEGAAVRDLVVLSSEAAFYLRPGLTEATRLLGLLRPSPSISSEVGRFYRLWARQYKWPVYTNPLRTFDDCLQPSRFRDVVGVHVRRREGSCRREAEHLGDLTVLSLTEGHYVLEGTQRSEGSATSTVARLANDCAWNVDSVVHVFRRYSQWLASRWQHCSPTRTAVGSPQNYDEGGDDGKWRCGARPHYTVFLADDEPVATMAQRVEVTLQHLATPPTQELLEDGMRPSFTAAYDRRTGESYQTAFHRAQARITAATAHHHNKTERRDAAEALLLKLLYPVAELEHMGLAFNFFMLSNTGVFRGSALSHVTANVCLRRWGRGLPCHGVMVGYYEALYTGVL